MYGVDNVASYYWIKLYHEILHDPKMGQLPDRTWRRAIELFLLAGETEMDGMLPSVPDIAWKLRVNEAELIEDLARLEAVGIITNGDDGLLTVTHFEERQAPMDDAERQRRKRERDRKQDYYCHDSLDAPVTEPVTNRDTETDKKQIQIREDTEADIEAETDRAANDAARVIAGTHARDPAAISKNLEAKGIQEPKRSQLVGKPWVTEDLIDDWWRYISTWQKAPNDVKLASLVNRLEGQRMPPPEFRNGAT